MTSWAGKYNLPDSAGATPTAMSSEVHKLGRGSVADTQLGRWWHPDSPLFWLGGLIAATVGFAAVSGSGSVRLGPIHASASAGAGK